jgi:hypothetical protein
MHLFFLFLIMVVQTAHAQNNTQFPDPPAVPTEVSISLSINEISHIDTTNETYTMDAYWHLSWEDPRIIEFGLDEGMIDDRDTINDLFGKKIWWPNPEIINTEGGRRKTSYQKIILNDLGVINYHERFTVTLGSEMNFGKIPFDTQQLLLGVESFGLVQDKMIFTSDASLLPAISNVRLKGWKIENNMHIIEESNAPTGIFSRYTSTLTIKRDPGYFLGAFFVPWLLLLCAVYLILWTNDCHLQMKLLAYTILSFVSFSFYSTKYLPAVPYTTFIDASILLGYLIIFFTMVTTAYRENLENNDNIELSIKRLHQVRLFLPILFFIGLFFIGIIFFL